MLGWMRVRSGRHGDWDLEITHHSVAAGDSQPADIDRHSFSFGDVGLRPARMKGPLSGCMRSPPEPFRGGLHGSPTTSVVSDPPASQCKVGTTRPAGSPGKVSLRPPPSPPGSRTWRGATDGHGRRVDAPAAYADPGPHPVAAGGRDPGQSHSNLGSVGHG